MTVERTLQLATVVPTITDAFTFVMGALDEIDDDARITISPIWTYEHSSDGERHHEVTVAGTPKRGAT